MDPTDRLNLQRMIKENDVEETTDLIRNVKHSKQIRDNVRALERLRDENAEMAANNPEDFDDMCIFHCGFLFNHYTDIYNKVKKNELDMTILENFLDVLEKPIIVPKIVAKNNDDTITLRLLSQPINNAHA